MLLLGLESLSPMSSEEVEQPQPSIQHQDVGVNGIAVKLMWYFLILYWILLYVSIVDILDVYTIIFCIGLLYQILLYSNVCFVKYYKNCCNTCGIVL